MKKITSLFLVILMLMLSISGVSAADGLTITAGNVTVCADEEQNVIVPVTIESNPGFGAFEVELTYDPAVFEPVALTAGEVINIPAGFPSPSLKFSDHSVKMTFLSLDMTGADVMGDGEIFTAEFKIISEDAVGTYPIDIICDSFAGGLTVVERERTLVPGSITVTRNEPEKVPAEVVSADMVDTTDVEGPNPSITSFMTVINTNDESVDALTWNVSYDGTTNSYFKSYDTTFTGTVRLGLYLENLYVADESLLDVNVELGKGE